MTRVRLAWLALPVVVVVVVAALAVDLIGSGGPSAPTLRGNELFARSDASWQLTRVRLPRGARRSAVEPTGDAGALALPAGVPGLPTYETHAHAWWIVPESAQRVTAFVNDHRPAKLIGGLSAPEAPSISAPTPTEYFGFPAIIGVLEYRELDVHVTALADGKAGVRADSWVTWFVPRPATESIPMATRRIVLLIGKANEQATGQPGLAGGRQVATEAPSKVRRIVTLINRLPLAANNHILFCPTGGGVPLQLTFYARPQSRPLAIATYVPAGCPYFELTINGRTQPPLTPAPEPGSGLATNLNVIAQLNTILHAHIPAER